MICKLTTPTEHPRPLGRPRLLPPREGLLPEDQEPAPERERQLLRSLEELRATSLLDDSALVELRESGMPTGPWDTDEIAKAEINSWARALGTVDRGFAVTCCHVGQP